MLDMQRVRGNVGARFAGGARCRRGHYQVMYPRLSVDGTRVPNAAAMTPIRDIFAPGPCMRCCEIKSVNPLTTVLVPRTPSDDYRGVQ